MDAGNALAILSVSVVVLAVFGHVVIERRDGRFRFQVGREDTPRGSLSVSMNHLHGSSTQAELRVAPREGERDGTQALVSPHAVPVTCPAKAGRNDD
jgi:hypothetical protein